MILGDITHPGLLSALATAGHTSRLLIADAHFPIEEVVQAAAARIHLNFAPGMLTAPEVLERIVRAVPVESAVAAPAPAGTHPELWEELASACSPHVRLEEATADWMFAAAGSASVRAAVATGDLRSGACVLLTVGVRHDG